MTPPAIIQTKPQTLFRETDRVQDDDSSEYYFIVTYIRFRGIVFIKPLLSDDSKETITDRL
jgi:hypothetical protein